MLTIAASVLMAGFLLAATALDSHTALFFALLFGAAYFAAQLGHILTDLPKFNILRLLSVGMGLFYFGGAAFAVGMQVALGGNAYSYIFAVWRNYDAAAMSQAALLVFACCQVGLAISKFIKPATMTTLLKPERFYNNSSAAVRAEVAVALIYTISVSLLCSLLLATGKLAVSGLVARNLEISREGAGLVTIANPAAVGAILVASWLISDRSLTVKTRFLGFLFALPIWLALFTMGRRYVIAGLVTFAIGHIVYRGVKVRPFHVVASIAGAAVAFFSLSGPFLAIRTLQQAGQTITLSQMLSVIASGDETTSTRSMSTADVAALSAARSDLMGEFSQIVARTPADSRHWGGGLLSQAALLVPGPLWDRKQEFLATKVHGDAAIARDASLPPTDLAGSLILYSFSELGWLAPIWFAGIFTALVFIADGLTRITRSYTVYLVTISTLISYAVVADNTAEARIVTDLRFFVVLAAIIGILSWLAKAQNKQIPSLGRLRPR